RLNRKGALVLDISVRNHAKAWTRLMETAGFPIAMAEQLQPVLAGKSTSTTMLYVDTITVEQAKAWLERLKLADYWNVPEYRTDGVCRSLLLYTLEGTGQQQVAYSFGLSKWSDLPADPSAKQAIALVYQPNRKTTSFSRELFRHISQLQGPRPDKLTLIIMLRTEK
ncbi:MAG TPA: hypothetical protein PKD72_09995, partial [Gemmatales bacterium]|nr:hypothetical protein [Gemmatales bacterium]